MKSWCDGPKEILLIAHRLAGEGQEASNRIALILIDNAVEVMAKTFLSLPRRITGINIPRKELDGIFESFPSVISCLEKNSDNRLSAIDLGEIEWHHGLRNKLYHDGSGLTIKPESITVYFQLAAQMFRALFNEVIVTKPIDDSERKLGSFLEKWIRLEKGLIGYSELVGDTYGRTPNLRAGLGLLAEEGKLPSDVHREIIDIQRLRNAIVHGQEDSKTALGNQVDARLHNIALWLTTVDKEFSGI